MKRYILYEIIKKIPVDISDGTMWKSLKITSYGKKNWDNRSRIARTFITAISILFFLAAIMALSNGAGTGYSPTTDKCISCHNDSNYPNDTNGDGVSAPYKRPHNDKVMCEKCHRSNPHDVAFIQPDGNYGSKDTAGSCPECHQTGINNFSSAFMIYPQLRHSSNIQNGSAFGNYWNNTSPKSACIFCHNKTLHNVKPLGRILEFAPEYVINTSIGANFTCSKCHYKGDTNWSIMNATFAAAGLETPPEITNGTNWNGRFLNYFNHSIVDYTDETCTHCHGRLLSSNATMSEFLHNVAFADSTACIGCHTSPTGPDNIYAAIDTASFGKHKNINSTGGNDILTDDDCRGCHYDITNMYNRTLNVSTRICTDCHIEGNFSAPIIKNHKPPKVTVSAGGNISTTAYCSICHNNSIKKYIYSVNASVSHYMTNESLVKTVNQTPRPRFGLMTAEDARQYNKDCNNCHNPSNSSYGNATLITVPHIGRGTCNECHVNGSASDLHNGSLGMPVNFSCISCHTTYASKYGAPDLTGTPMGYYTSCGGGNCHYNETDRLDSIALHNVDRTFAGTPGSTDTVYLNNYVSLTVTKGVIVNITSRVNDTLKYGGASRIAGAEYYIDVDPGQGKGIPMDAVDGKYDAVMNNWENVKATIDTNTLSDGTHTIFVRGMDIGKQWSAPQGATLIMESYGYINGTVTNGTSPIPGAIVSTNGANDTTDANGIYSLTLYEGTYTVNASKLPEYYGNSGSGRVVTPKNTTIFNIVLSEKPKGIITGTVTAIGSGSFTFSGGPEIGSLFTG